MAWWDNLAARLRAIFGSVPGGFDWETAGPSDDEHPIVRASEQAWSDHGPTFVDGWWTGADRKPAHAKRIGPAIVPRAIVVHTTDTLNAFDAIVKSWTTTPGAGNAAHFMIGRTSGEGVVQFAPITRNANHAGGHVHGNFQSASTGLIHPNTVSVGIELEAGGRLKRAGSTWVHPDTKKVVPDANVYVDARGVGWHVVTDYQLAVLDSLLDGLWMQLQRRKLVAVPDDDYAKNGVPWAGMPGELVGHVTLDPINKTDPGPQVLQHLRSLVLG
jgi:hypothetical protein